MLKVNQLKGLFEELKINNEHKGKLFNEMIAKIESENKQQSKTIYRRNLKSAMLTAAVMICLVMTTAFAAAYIGLDMKFLNFLNPANSKQEAYLDNGALVVNKQATNENGTLEVRQIIGDSNLIYLLMDFTAPEDMVLNKERYRFETHLDFDINGSHSSGHNYYLLEDENPNDNKISLILSYLMTDRTIIGSPVTLRIIDLEEADAYPDVFETVISGSWETEFKMDYKDISTMYPSNKEISLYGYEATLSSVSISPISVAINVDSAHTKAISEAVSLSRKEIGVNEYEDIYPITIHYKDGTSETTSIFNGMVVADNLRGSITIVKTFTPIINDKEIESVVFFDAVIPVN